MSLIRPLAPTRPPLARGEWLIPITPTRPLARPYRGEWASGRVSRPEGRMKKNQDHGRVARRGPMEEAVTAPKPLTRRELAWKTHTLTQDAAAYRAEVQRLRAELAELRHGQGQR